MTSQRKERRGGMPISEAARKGGLARFSQLGPEGMSELGRRGGEKVRDLIERGKRNERERLAAHAGPGEEPGGPDAEDSSGSTGTERS